MDNAEKMAADIAVKLNGGEWSDGKWYSEGHRKAWVEAVKPHADEIERLRVKLNEATKLAEDSILAVESFHKRNIQASKLMAEALDEIERLQEAVVEIVYQIGQGNNMAAMDIASLIAEAYLKQKESE